MNIYIKHVRNSNCVLQKEEDNGQDSYLEPETLADPSMTSTRDGISISTTASDAVEKGHEPTDLKKSVTIEDSKEDLHGVEVTKKERTWIGSVTQPVSAVVSGVESKVVSAATYLSGTATSAKDTLMSGITALEEAIVGTSDPIDDDDKI